MKLAVLADIHANLPALQSVIDHIERWQPDQVIVAGDIVNRGPSPLACLQQVQAKVQDEGWLVVCGNHEEYILNVADKRDTLSQPMLEMLRFTDWTAQKLSQHLATLDALPFQQSLTAPNGLEVRIVHASMLSNRDGVFPRTTDAELRQKIAPPPALLCVGHTHWPLVRHVDDTIVVNVGAVGLPFDQDTRASYAQISWHHGAWHPEIIRLAYDHQQAIQDFTETNFIVEGGPLATLILDELHHARSNLYRWTAQYQAPILAGEISIATAAEQFMQQR